MTAEIFEQPKIRQFLTFQEIKDLEGYKPNNPVNRQTYKSFLGHYTFSEDVHCCFENVTGNLCNEDHKFGFVVQLRDSSVTVVGNTCAVEKLGADPNIRADATRYVNERRRLERFQALDEIISKTSEFEVRLENCINFIERIQSQKDDFLGNFGNSIVTTLHNMAKQGNSRVIVRTISFRTLQQNDGTIEREKTVNHNTIGNVRGINSVSDQIYRSLISQAKLIKRKLLAAKNISRDAKQTQIDESVSTIRQTDSLEKSIQSLAAELNNFKQTSPELFCYLTADKSERIRAAKYALEIMGLSSNRDFAKSWLSQNDSNIATQFGADRVDL